MKLMTTQLLKRVGALSLMVGLSAAAVEAQSVSGEAFGTYVQTLFASQGKTPVATLPGVAPGNGEMAEASADNNGVPGAVSTDLLTSVATGSIVEGQPSAQSVATVADVSILDGLITAARVIAVATSWGGGGAGTTSEAAGSTFEGLVVSGTPFGENVDPNTRVDLPGVGYVVLNEQMQNATGITVNMIHVVLQTVIPGQCIPLVGCTPDVTKDTGDIIVGSASSAVS